MALEAVHEDFVPVPPEPVSTDAADTCTAPAAASWRATWPAGLVRSMTSATEAVAAALVELGWDRTDG